MVSVASSLAAWATSLHETTKDEALADRSLRDTVAVALAGADQPVVRYASELQNVGQWAAAAHVLDFDDLHLKSTTHISTVIVPVAIGTGGGAPAYLAGAGVMSRVGIMLGWQHYERGWHATCTAGALGAAAAAAVAIGLDEEVTAHALALAVPAGGGVQRAFGTDAKSLQVGMTANAGLCAASLAARGARGDLTAVDQWLDLLGAATTEIDPSDEAVPGGLGIKLFPCCYAMQRPIYAIRAAAVGRDLTDLDRVVVHTPAATVKPLIHHRPTTGLEGKFSLEYAVATALLDEFPTMASFTDAQVRRPAAWEIMNRVTIDLTDGGAGLLDGQCDVELHASDGSVATATLEFPPGSPAVPPTATELDQKWTGLGTDIAQAVADLRWDDARTPLTTWIARA
jgi:2-methylcitrate dehydratase PrpD